MRDLGCVMLNLAAPPTMLSETFTCKSRTTGTGAAGAWDRTGAWAVCLAMQEVSCQAGQIPLQRAPWASAAFPGTGRSRVRSIKAKPSWPSTFGKSNAGGIPPDPLDAACCIFKPSKATKPRQRRPWASPHPRMNYAVLRRDEIKRPGVWQFGAPPV